MNTLTYYRGQEHDTERQDPNDGIERILQMKGAKLKKKNPVSGEYEEIADITGGVGRIINSNLDKLNVFCTFHFLLPNNKETSLGDVVNERVWKGFGDTAVIIGNFADFVTRIKQAAHARGLIHMRDLVEYADMSTRHDEVGPYIKDQRCFSHQQELRIAVFDSGSEPGPISLNIGSIGNIAWLVPANEVAKLTLLSSRY